MMKKRMKEGGKEDGRKDEKSTPINREKQKIHIFWLARGNILSESLRASSKKPLSQLFLGRLKQ